MVRNVCLTLIATYSAKYNYKETYCRRPHEKFKGWEAAVWAAVPRRLRFRLRDLS